MQLDKKQLPQFIVLGVLVVICIGYVSFKVLAPKPTVPPAPVSSAEEKGLSTGDMEPGVTSVAVTEAATEAGVFPGITSVPSRRDPFAPQKLPYAVDVQTRVQPPVSTPRVNPLPRPSRLGASPWVKVQPIQPIPPISQSAATAAAVPQPSEPELTLTGVIRGEQNVAIIRSGDKGRYIVKQGQMIDGRYRVLSVTADTAVLAGTNRTIRVKLGGVN